MNKKVSKIKKDNKLEAEELETDESFVKSKRFKNTILFSEEAQKFIRTGKYTEATEGSPAYVEYWNEQKRRCKEGYTVGKTTITGRHYYYLNFSPIKKVTFDAKGRATKTSSGWQFGDFWDGDYDFFWIKDIARDGITKEELDKLGLFCEPVDYEEGGKHIVLGKARRKGYSFKNASLASYEYTFEPNSTTLLLAFDKKYLLGDAIMDKTLDILDFLMEHTGFGKNRLVDKKEHVQAGYIEDGIKKGSKSQILAISLQDNPEGAAGKSASLIIMEEAGTFANLEDALAAIKPCVEAGIYTTGQIIIFGTGGNMEGATIDFQKIFYDPSSYKILGFRNKWDIQEANKVVGAFHPAYLNCEGYMDSDGNSDIKGALDYYNKIREKLKETAKDKKTFTGQIIAYPFTPKEVFSVRSNSVLPIGEIMQQLAWVENNPNIDNRGTRGYLSTDEAGKIVFNKDNNLHEVPFPMKKDADFEGCLTIYEQPPEGDIPYGLYIAGLDPYAQDKSTYSDSLGSIMIYKRTSISDTTGDRLVAEYTARPTSIKEYNENIRKLLLFYNAVCLYENMQNNIKEYFENKNCVYLLADTPTCLRATINSQVRRGKGIHMTKDIKNELELYLRDWLLETNSEGVPNIKFVYSLSLLNELLYYNETGNFDRVIALMMCILYKIQLTKIAVDGKKEKELDPFFTKNLFNNSKLSFKKTMFHNHE